MILLNILIERLRNIKNNLIYLYFSCAKLGLCPFNIPNGCSKSSQFIYIFHAQALITYLTVFFTILNIFF